MEESPSVSAKMPTPVPQLAPGSNQAGWSDLRDRWSRSLAFRLVATSLLPLLVALPLTLLSLLYFGGKRIDDILLSNMNSQLASANTHLLAIKVDTGQRVAQLARSERIGLVLDPATAPSEARRLLRQAAEDANLDFLLVALTDGQVVAATDGDPQQLKLPDVREVRQAMIGVANAGYARISLQELDRLAPQAHAQITSRQKDKAPSSALILSAGAHFPLDVATPDAILYGGKLLNQNTPLISHLREVIYPVDALPDSSEGIAALAIDGTVVTSSRQRSGLRTLQGTALPTLPTPMEGHARAMWRGKLLLDGQPYIVGLQHLGDEGEGAVGTLQLAFPYAPYQHDIRILIGSVGGMITVTMVLLTWAYRSTGQMLATRLNTMSQTLVEIRQGNRAARMGTHPHNDELNVLTIAFNQMLNTIAEQDRAQAQAQRTIADEASRRRALFQHERDGVVIVNTDGTVFEANPKMSSLLGYTAQEMTTLHITDWEASLNATEVKHVLASLGEEGAIFETELKRKDASRFPAEVSISKATWTGRVFIVASIRDITERRSVQQELENYRQRLELLVERRTRELNDRTEQLNTIFALSPDGFVSFDRTGKVNSANAAFLRMTGLTTNDVVGRTEASFSTAFARLCTNPSAFPGVEAMAKAWRVNGDASAADTLAKGRRPTVELSGPGNRVLELDLQTSESAFISHVLYVRDVTHETEVDRMKSEFLSTAAHELRTPMASIYGFSELLLARKFSDEKRKDLLETISRQATRMSTIIDELLDLARIEARQGKDFVLERVNLPDIVNTVAGDYKVPEGRQAPILEIAQDWLPVRADRGKLQQAVLNLLSNAYKYSPDGGDVHLGCATADDGRTVVLSIRDHGMGMTEEQLSRVFERFYRADTSGHIPGTGLGMSIVKEIVELHNGTVSMESSFGKGSVVTLRLPLDTEVPGQADSHMEQNEVSDASAD